MRPPFRIAVCILWLMIAIYLLAFEIIRLVPYAVERPHVEFWITLSIMGTFVACAGIGAVLGIMNRPPGRLLLGIAAGFMLLYFLSYLLLGGLDDARSYLPYLVGFAILSVATFWLRTNSTRISVEKG